ncbi:MAG: prolyl oligopeptidase family serine peptidase [Candidatus Eisenbacteria bacterium]|nr:prolyl oligopeptidase family serine peptidase [Candidatus Eisenbacteria bacterium]
MYRTVLFSAVLLVGLAGMVSSVERPVMNYPPFPKGSAVDTIFGTAVPDPYRELENYRDPKVQEWLSAEEKTARTILDKLPQRAGLTKRLTELRRYDDRSAPEKALVGERIFYRAIKKDWERWAYYTKENEKAKPVLLLDPNKWATNTLDLTDASRDGRYLAYGVSEAGREDPRIKIMEVATGKSVPDSLHGWRQGGVAWLPDGSGFYYTCSPAKGDVPEGEEEYWDAVYFHKLGTAASEDKKVFYHDKVKEFSHLCFISEDGKYEFFNRGLFYKNEVYFRPLGGSGALVPITTDMDAEYHAFEIEGRLIIWTDKDAPRGKVYSTGVDKPGKENWQVLIPETGDKLLYVTGVAGHLYAVYTHNAYTIIKIYTLDGKYIRDLPLPTVGSSHVWGYWSKPDIWVQFTSFTYPGTTFKYDFAKNKLVLFHKPPIHIDSALYTTEQVWFKSKDGTKVSMFLVHRKGLVKNGLVPTYLTAYGGFNIGIGPRFSSSYMTWLEAGGVVAIPNLRGGGEYGKEWHEAGMFEKKQNVFDDFIGAAEWLIANKYTSPQKLAIGGGSNGGLLMGAVLTQRPDLFKAVYCGVPLLDMIRYQKFGYSNIWAEEYGSSDNADQFPYLLKYSPYQNVRAGTEYPSVLFVASDNDPRVHPLHAMKMAARMQDADPNGAPILLIIQKESGHGGGTRISESIDQQVDIYSFLMSSVGITSPKKK